MAYSTRKLYSGLGLSFSDYFKGTSYAAKEQEEKREFEKPYLEKNYLKGKEDLALPKWKTEGLDVGPKTFLQTRESPYGTFTTEGERKQAKVWGDVIVDEGDMVLGDKRTVTAAAIFPISRPEVVEWITESEDTGNIDFAETRIIDKYTPFVSAEVSLECVGEPLSGQVVGVSFKARVKGMEDPWEKVPFLLEKDIGKRGDVMRASQAVGVSYVSQLTAFRAESAANKSGFVTKAHAVWATCRAGTDGDSAGTGACTNLVVMTNLNATPEYWIRRAFYWFDLSSIDSEGICDSASLKIMGQSRHESYSAVAMSIQEGTQGDTLTTADFDALTGNYFTTMAAGTWSGAGWNTFTLNAAGIAYVENAFGSGAYFCIRDYTHDYLNSAPGALEYWGNGMCLGAGAEQFKPILEFYYHL